MYRYPKIVDNTKPYIVTNPAPDTILSDKDIVFVLSPYMPDQNITVAWGSPFEGIQKETMALNLNKKKKHFEQEFEEDIVSTNSDININAKKKDLGLN